MRAFFLNKPDRVESLILDVALSILITVHCRASDASRHAGHRCAALPCRRHEHALGRRLLTVAFASKLRPLAGIIVLIVGLRGLTSSRRFNRVNSPARAVLYVWLFITIPACVSVVVNLLFAPAPRARRSGRSPRGCAWRRGINHPDPYERAPPPRRH